MQIITEKCEWICLGQNNPQTRYSLGRKILERIMTGEVCSEVVAETKVGWAGGEGMALEDG